MPLIPDAIGISLTEYVLALLGVSAPPVIGAVVAWYVGSWVVRIFLRWYTSTDVAASK
jgi:hypothetical protein